MRSLSISIVITAFIFSFGIERSVAAPTGVLTPKAGEMNAHFIDVGQGSSVLLEFSCGAALIDTGAEKNERYDGVKTLQDYLDNFFKRRTDLNNTFELLVITHPHIDHTRGLPQILKNYQIHHLVDDGLESGSGGRQQKMAHQKAKASGGEMTWEPVTEHEVVGLQGLTNEAISPINCGTKSPKFHVLWGGLAAANGWDKTIIDNENDSSVVTRLDFGKSSFLFPGDLEDDVHDDVINYYCPDKNSPSCALNVDVYHVAHHGSHNGTSEALLQTMSPRIAVISMGPWNRRIQWSAQQYGHPRKDTVDRLLAPQTGVQDKRPPITAMVANRGASRSTNSASGAQFSKYDINKAVYGTAWDGNIVIAADVNGNLRVMTNR